MKPKEAPFSRLAFTRVELLVVLGALALLAVVALPVLAANVPRGSRVECLNNLRRIGQAFHIWANEHNDLFPWKVSPSQGGAMAGSLVDYFRAASNQLVTPRILVCPSDGARSRASDFADLSERYNLSYFAGLNANLSLNSSWLSGDRNFRDYSGISPLTLTPTNHYGWDLSIHVASGNVLFSDGNVAEISNRQVSNAVFKAVAQGIDGYIRVVRPQ